MQCPSCQGDRFKVLAKPRLWEVYCANDKCGAIIMDVPESSIIPLLFKKYKDPA